MVNIYNFALYNRVSSIIRSYIDNMQFAAYMAVWFIAFFYIPMFQMCIVLYMALYLVRLCLIL